MADLAIVAQLALVVWALLEFERRRHEAEELDRRFRAALAAVPDAATTVRRFVDGFAGAVASMGAAYAGAMRSVVAGVTAAAEAAARLAGDVTTLPSLCHCGARSDGRHDHVARMVAGGRPDLVLVPDELVPLGVLLAAPALDVARLPVLAATVVDAATLPHLAVDRSLPPVRGIPWVREVSRG